MDASIVSKEYQRLGYNQGWTFAMTPVANLLKARAILVGLNPGGAEEDGYTEDWEVPEGNAYFDGRWIPGSDNLMPIQVQIIALHQLLGLAKDETFAGQFIPFRSSSKNALENQTEAFGFGLKLWEWVIGQSPAKLFICLGADASFNIAKLLDAKPNGGELNKGLPPGRFRSGWGKTTIGRYLNETTGKVVVELPHLSWYQLFSMQGAPLEIARNSIKEACQPWPVEV